MYRVFTRNMPLLDESGSPIIETDITTPPAMRGTSFYFEMANGNLIFRPVFPARPARIS